MLVATDICKSYGDISALQGIDLQVEAGQVVSLLGRNGAGKSTMLSVLAGLTKADSGSVEVGGFDSSMHPDKVAELIGIAPQETGIYPPLTVRENLEFFAELAKVGRSQREASVSNAAERLGLGQLLDRRGSQLSGGEARRLHTACALLHEPRLLMLDEPTVGADVETRAMLISAVTELAEGGAAVIYTTHYLPEVEALDADIVVIDDGRVLARGTQQQLIDAEARMGLACRFAGQLPDDVAKGLAADDVVVERGVQRGGEVSSGMTEYRLFGDISIAELVSRLGPAAALLQSVETIRPNLEEVFLSITGGRLS